MSGGKTKRMQIATEYKSKRVTVGVTGKVATLGVYLIRFGVVLV